MRCSLLHRDFLAIAAIRLGWLLQARLRIFLRGPHTATCTLGNTSTVLLLAPVASADLIIEARRATTRHLRAIHHAFSEVDSLRVQRAPRRPIWS